MVFVIIAFAVFLLLVITNIQSYKRGIVDTVNAIVCTHDPNYDKIRQVLREHGYVITVEECWEDDCEYDYDPRDYH